MQAAMEAEGAASRRQPRRSPSIRDPLEDQVLAGQVVESQTLDHFSCRRFGSPLKDGACTEHERLAAKVGLPHPLTTDAGGYVTETSPLSTRPWPLRV
jgi:hypothetical protein